MTDSAYYPAGAYGDPDAPYNQDGFSFNDAVRSDIDYEIDYLDQHYLEWLSGRYIVEDIPDPIFCDCAKALAGIQQIRDEYSEHAWDRVASNH